MVVEGAAFVRKPQVLYVVRLGSERYNATAKLLNANPVGAHRPISSEFDCARFRM